MGIKRGSITTPIIADGLVLNIDAFNVNSILPFKEDENYSAIEHVYNTVGNGRGQTSTTGSIIGGFDMWEGPTTASFHFDNGDHIELNKNTTDFISVNSPFTLCAFIKYGHGDFFSNTLTNSPTETNKLEFQVDNDNSIVKIKLNSTTLNSSFSFNWNPGGNRLNTWFYISWVFEVRTQGALIAKSLLGYLNGKPGISNSTTNSYTLPTSDIRIGYTDSNNREKNISNLQFYNRALSANEILHNYNALKGRFGL